jgi:two-component system chemotaxis sensor kinase CheA
MHSIKGTASFFGLKNIVNLSHAVENLFGEIRNGKLDTDNEMIDILLSANDCLKTMIANVENSEGTDVSGHTSRIMALLNRRPGNGRQIEPSQPPSPAPAAEAGEIASIRDALSLGRGIYKIKISQESNPSEFLKKAKSIGQVLYGLQERPGPDKSCEFLISTVLEKSLASLALDVPEESITELTGNDLAPGTAFTPPQGNFARPAADGLYFNDQAELDKADICSAHTGLPAAVEAEEATQTRQAAGADDTIRVHVSLLNDLLNLASEMVLGRNQLLRTMDTHRKKIPGLNALLQNIDGITTELQEKIMQTRMQPVAKVFNKFPRIIREMARKMNKDIKLQMEGVEVELDKSIVEALGDPLTHLIRNAADHGIEMPDQREKSGKTRAGTITLRAYHEGGRVNIDISDDGVGINLEDLRTKALQKGLISPAEAELAGDRELLEMLFRPGFSTAERVTDVSGRGVGLDVVKTNIEKLGGTIEIMTSLRRGATFHLTLPLTLAVISSQIVEVEGQKFALPLVNLQGMVRIKPGDSSRKIDQIYDSQMLRFRGRLLPLVHLAGVLGLRKDPIDTGKIIRVLVIKSSFKLFGLVVDNIHDGEEILIKPVPRHLNNCQCYSGVTIMGDGRIAMILDPEGISSRAGLRYLDEAGEPVTQDAVSTWERLAERQNLLMFKCSGPETFSIDLSMVARVEKIHSAQIEKIGPKEFIQFRGEALRVIRPENYLPVTKMKNDGQNLYVIVPKLVTRPMGILIHKILDTMEARVQFNQEDIKAKGLIGSAILDNRIVLFINIYEIFELADPESLPADVEADTGIKRTVLLVEDTPFFVKLEKKYIESGGYHVLTAYNGREAWKILQESEVDAVVSDIEMPVMDGFELVRRIRSDKKLSSLPVIAVTSKADEGSIRRGMEAGFDFYEIKLDRERLLEKIYLAFNKRSDVV